MNEVGNPGAQSTTTGLPRFMPHVRARMTLEFGYGIVCCSMLAVAAYTHEPNPAVCIGLGRMPPRKLSEHQQCRVAKQLTCD